jgi:iron-sulfur cluster assembly protein
MLRLEVKNLNVEIDPAARKAFRPARAARPRPAFQRWACRHSCEKLPCLDHGLGQRIEFNQLRFENGSENMMATARLRPQMMRLTDAAADRIKSVMANAGRPIVGVRVGVKNGGCAGMAYTMEYAEKVEPSDEVVEDKGVRVLIDPKAVLFLLGTEMGYKVEKLAAQFVFNNPNQTSACGCGESVQLTPATETH